MNDMICWLIGGLITMSIYLILSSQLMRWLFGLVILSSSINLLLFIAGRLSGSNPAFIFKTGQAAVAPLANPLPQALILTAIVISFGLLAFALVLVRRVWQSVHTTNSDTLGRFEVKASKPLKRSKALEKEV